jgi:hypothetical protein
VTAVTEDVNLEDLINDDDHECAFQEGGVKCSNPGTHALVQGCKCKQVLYVCNEHLALVLTCSFTCTGCWQSHYFREV